MAVPVQQFQVIRTVGQVPPVNLQQIRVPQELLEQSPICTPGRVVDVTPGRSGSGSIHSAGYHRGRRALHSGGTLQPEIVTPVGYVPMRQDRMPSPDTSSLRQEKLVQMASTPVRLRHFTFHHMS